VDGLNIRVVGRVHQRNVNALMMGLSAFSDVGITLVPSSGQGKAEVLNTVGQQVLLSLSHP
jgi:hypothetical protein